MPELPEVQSIVDGLSKKIIGKTIVELIEKKDKFIKKFSDIKLENLGRIDKISRKGKYIIIYTKNQYQILIHLRLTGKLIYAEDQIFRQMNRIRAELIFLDKSRVLFDDRRGFGTIEVYPQSFVVPALQNLGVDPLKNDFNVKYLLQKMKNRRIPIKNLLLDQKIISGIGNIYACEILYKVMLHPGTPSGKIDFDLAKKIVQETKVTLLKAISCNGTSISDYRSVDDKTGEFQNFLRVYQKTLCPKGHKIQKIKQSGRGTYYCPICQN